MFSFARKFLGSLKVNQRRDHVIISGVDGHYIQRLLINKWGTSTVPNSFFNDVSSSKLVLNRFFLPDFTYTLEAIRDDSKMRRNIVLINKLIEEIYENTWIKDTLEDYPSILNTDKLKLFHKKPLPHQEDFFKTYDQNTQKFNLNGFLLGAAAGSGKAQPLDTKLRTTSGYILMKDIQKGDYVLDRFLRPTLVTGVFPQGKKKVFKITLEDGRETRACLEHLWTITLNGVRKTVDTSEIISLLDANEKVFIDLPKKLGITTDKTVTVEVVKEKDVLELVIDKYRSIGAVVTFKARKDHFEVSVTFRKDSLIEIKSIEADGIEPVQCIKVSNSESLYICDDWIVTHNTLASLMLSRMLETDTNIFLVPKNSLDRVWRASIEEEIKEKPNYWISDGTMELKTGYKDYIIHHDHIPKVMDFFKENKDELGTTFINLDESHFFNEVRSQRTRNLVELSRDVLQSKHVLFMSGTPIKAVGNEAVPLLRCIDDYFTKDVEDRFIRIFGRTVGRANDILQHRMGFLTFKIDKELTVGNTVHLFNGYVKSKNRDDFTLPAIRELMREFVTERLKFYTDRMDEYVGEYFRLIDVYRDTLKSPTAVSELDEYLKTAKLIREHYDPVDRREDIRYCTRFERTKIEPTLDSEDRKSFRDVKSVYKYYFLKVQGEALGRILGKARTDATLDIINSLDKIELKDEKGRVIGVTSIDEEIMSTEKKTLIFTSHVAAVKECEKYLKKKGYNPIIVYGGNTNELAQIVKRFEKDKSLNPLITTFKSLSTAVPLIMANVTIMLNAPFRDYEFQQALSRTDRVGQDSDVYCTTLYLDTGDIPNVSTRSKEIMEWSREQIEEIMGFKTMEGVGIEDMSSFKSSTDLYDEFVKSLSEKLGMGVDFETSDDSLFQTSSKNEVINVRVNDGITKFWSKW